MQAVFARLVAAEHHIIHSGFQSGQQPFGLVHPDIKAGLAARIGAEVCQHFGQVGVHHRRDAADGHPLGSGAEIPHDRRSGFQRIQPSLHIAQKGPACVGQHHIAPPPGEQQHAQLLFQQGDGTAEGRLGDGKGIGSFGVVLGLGQNAEIPQLVQGHVRSTPLG